MGFVCCQFECKTQTVDKVLDAHFDDSLSVNLPIHVTLFYR